MPHARKKNVHAKPLKLLKPRSAPINTCVENDDWPRAKPGGRKRCFIRHEDTNRIKSLKWKVQNHSSKCKIVEAFRRYFFGIDGFWGLGNKDDWIPA